jgi:hypothetical protein
LPRRARTVLGPKLFNHSLFKVGLLTSAFRAGALGILSLCLFFTTGRLESFRCGFLTPGFVSGLRARLNRSLACRLFRRRPRKALLVGGLPLAL